MWSRVSLIMDSNAAVLREPIDSHEFSAEQPVRVEAIEIREPTGEEVLVEVGAASLCHTDVAMTLGHLKESFPLVMGHEGAGYVRAVGEAVESVEPGDQVVLGRTACGRCQYCRMGRSNLCARRSESREAGTLRTGAIGFSLDGEPVHHCHGVSSFAEHTLVTEEVAIEVADDLPVEQASLLGCGVFTGAGAVMNTVSVEAGASVAIFGCGGVGLSAIQAARLRGANEIIGVDIVSEKLERAESLGATGTINSEEADPAERIRDLTDGGVKYAFEVVGNPAVIAQAVDSLSTLGTAVLVGVPPAGKHDIPIDFFDMVTGEQRIIGSFNGSYNLQLAIPRLAKLIVGGEFEVEPLITGRRSIEEVNEAMEELETGTGIRQLIIP
jgi:S-(hydroxymethyl)glutathione dehydrogenase/alcohol dehydrogenase